MQGQRENPCTIPGSQNSRDGDDLCLWSATPLRLLSVAQTANTIPSVTLATEAARDSLVIRHFGCRLSRQVVVDYPFSILGLVGNDGWFQTSAHQLINIRLVFPSRRRIASTNQRATLLFIYSLTRNQLHRLRALDSQPAANQGFQLSLCLAFARRRYEYFQGRQAAVLILTPAVPLLLERFKIWR
jgi:hypothetical protein